MGRPTTGEGAVAVAVEDVYLAITVIILPVTAPFEGAGVDRVIVVVTVHTRVEAVPVLIDAWWIEGAVAVVVHPIASLLGPGRNLVVGVVAVVAIGEMSRRSCARLHGGVWISKAIAIDVGVEGVQAAGSNGFGLPFDGRVTVTHHGDAIPLGGVCEVAE
jgi:hypothetical protein